jgi:hypothetical protein
MASLEVGFSHDIFVEWASDAKNLVLFTERGQVFCRTLVDFSTKHFKLRCTCEKTFNIVFCFLKFR